MVGRAAPVDYRGADGELTTYCKFSSVDKFISGYWHFIESGPYAGWDRYEDDGAGYVRHLSRNGYAADPAYVGKVVALFEEAASLLGAEEAGAVPVPQSGAPPSNPQTRVAVVVGHNSRAQGASGLPPISMSEYVFNTKVAAEMKEEAWHYNIVAETFFRPAGKPYVTEIAEAYAAVSSWRPDCAIELHFNSNGPSASRSEVLCRPNDSGTHALAENVLGSTVDLLGLPNGGVKIRNRGERGAASLFALPHVPTILVEPFFGSNRGDCTKVASVGQEALALAYLRGIRDWATSGSG
jgi:N-acetylmuramoyl-L-alanine amidase